MAIIDSGIDHDHPEFDVRSGTDCTGGGPFSGSCSRTAPADGDDDGDGGGDEGGGGDGGTVGWGLQATGRKVKGSQAVDLAWATAAAGDATAVDVYRDGTRIAAGTANDGAYTDSIGRKGGGSYTYQVCGGGTCSAE